MSRAQITGAWGWVTDFEDSVSSSSLEKIDVGAGRFRERLGERKKESELWSEKIDQKI